MDGCRGVQRRRESTRLRRSPETEGNYLRKYYGMVGLRGRGGPAFFSSSFSFAFFYFLLHFLPPSLSFLFLFSLFFLFTRKSFLLSLFSPTPSLPLPFAFPFLLPSSASSLSPFSPSFAIPSSLILPRHPFPLSSSLYPL